MTHDPRRRRNHASGRRRWCLRDAFVVRRVVRLAHAPGGLDRRGRLGRGILDLAHFHIAMTVAFMPARRAARRAAAAFHAAAGIAATLITALAAHPLEPALATSLRSDVATVVVARIATFRWIVHPFVIIELAAAAAAVQGAKQRLERMWAARAARTAAATRRAAIARAIGTATFAATPFAILVATAAAATHAVASREAGFLAAPFVITVEAVAAYAR